MRNVFLRGMNPWSWPNDEIDEWRRSLFSQYSPTGKISWTSSSRSMWLRKSGEVLVHFLLNNSVSNPMTTSFSLWHFRRAGSDADDRSLPSTAWGWESILIIRWGVYQWQWMVVCLCSQWRVLMRIKCTKAWDNYIVVLNVMWLFGMGCDWWDEKAWNIVYASMEK